MTINTTTLEASLQTKLNATTGTTDGKEFLLLGKALEAVVPSVTVSSVIAEGTTQVGLVTTEGTTQVAAVQNAVTNLSSINVAETRSASVNMADNVIQRPVLKDYAETKVAMAANDADLSLGNVQTKTISGVATLTFSNPPATGSSGSFTLILTNGGSAAVTWPTSVDWPLATAPTLTAAGVDVLVFTTIDAGTTWYGIAAGIGMA